VVAQSLFNFNFEVRIPTQDDQLELARRSALRAYVTRDYQTARRDVARMLQLNPTSIFAYVIQGDIESAERAWAAAVASYQTALRLLDSGSDLRLPAPRLHLRDEIVMRLERARLRVGFAERALEVVRLTDVDMKATA